MQRGPRYSQMGPWRTIESPRSRLNRVTIKVKWEVHSGPFKGLSQHTQGFEFDDEWCHKGQRSFVGLQSRVSERGQGQDQECSSSCVTLLSLKVWKLQTWIQKSVVTVYCTELTLTCQMCIVYFTWIWADRDVLKPLNANTFTAPRLCKQC